MYSDVYSTTYDDTTNPNNPPEYQSRLPSSKSRDFNSRVSGRSFATTGSSGIGSISSRSSSVQQFQAELPEGGGGGSSGQEREKRRCGCGCCGCATGGGCCWRAVVVIIGLCILGTMVALLTVYLLSSSPGCIEQYTVSDQHSAWGGKDVGWQSMSSCMRLCENYVETCYGLDYSDEGICWLHLLRLYALNPGNTPGVKNYRRQFVCDPEILCVEKYTVTTDRQAEGGVLIEFASSVPACMAHCESSNNCYGFDHKDEFGKGKCWIHLTSGYTLSSQPTPGFTNYRRLFRCRREMKKFTTLPPIFTTRRTKK